MRTELQRNFQLVIHMRMKVWVPVAHGCLLRHELDMTNGKSPSHSKNQEELREIKRIPKPRSPKSQGRQDSGMESGCPCEMLVTSRVLGEKVGSGGQGGDWRHRASLSSDHAKPFQLEQDTPAFQQTRSKLGHMA